MRLNERDRQLLIHIIVHCREVNSALSHFGKDKDKFMKNAVFINACSMPVLQIGELAKHLSEDLIKASQNIPWRQIKGMRDFFAHDYKGMDKNIIWETVTKGIPDLLKKCRNLLRELNKEKNNKSIIIKNYIREKNFQKGYELALEENIDDMDFMKEVVKKHGTNGNILQKAVQVVSDIKDQSPAFMAKLLNDTLKTEEYKEAFEAEHSDKRENSKDFTKYSKQSF